MATRITSNNNISSPISAETLKSQATQKAKQQDSDDVKEATAGRKNPNWRVDLSDQAKDMAQAHAKAYEIAKATPEVREEKIAALKKQIAEGKYQMDSGKIADGMMREAIRDHLAIQERS